MGSRKRRVATVVVVAAGAAAATLLVGLVTNAASEQDEWPGILSYVQRHPWLSLASLAAMVIALASVLAVLSGTDPTVVARSGEGPLDDQLSAGSLAPVLRTLPRDLSVFTDRRAEIDSIMRSLDRLTAGDISLPIHTVDGMAGVGKPIPGKLTQIRI